MRGKESAPVLRHPGAETLLDAADQELFQALRLWRAETARTQGVPAYVILHDRSLREIASRRPTDITELLDIPGIGAAKADRYAEALLRLVA